MIIFNYWMEIANITLKGTEKQKLRILADKLDLTKKIYMNILLKSKAETGNAFADEAVKSDMKSCSAFNEITKQSIEEHR